MYVLELTGAGWIVDTDTLGYTPAAVSNHSRPVISKFLQNCSNHTMVATCIPTVSSDCLLEQLLIFAPSLFFLRYTSYVVHIFK